MLGADPQPRDRDVVLAAGGLERELILADDEVCRIERDRDRLPARLELRRRLPFFAARPLTFTVSDCFAEPWMRSVSCVDCGLRVRQRHVDRREPIGDRGALVVDHLAEVPARHRQAEPNVASEADVGGIDHDLAVDARDARCGGSARARTPRARCARACGGAASRLGAGVAHRRDADRGIVVASRFFLPPHAATHRESARSERIIFGCDCTPREFLWRSAHACRRLIQGALDVRLVIERACRDPEHAQRRRRCPPRSRGSAERTPRPPAKLLRLEEFLRVGVRPSMIIGFGDRPRLLARRLRWRARLREA